MEKKKERPKVKVGSIFSGVGMFELGFKYLNIEYEHLWEIEFDKFARKSYQAIHGKVPEYEDVNDVDEKKLKKADIIVWGSPCQDFSVAGKGKGSEWTCLDCNHSYNPIITNFKERDKCPSCNSENIEKTRSSLLVEGLRIVRENNPKISIYENVKGITNKNHIETFNLMLKELEEYGYSNYYKVLNTKNFGVPQNRERVFLISIRKDIDKGYDFPEEFDNGIRLKHILEEEVDEKYYIGDEKCKKLLEEIKNNKKMEEPQSAFLGNYPMVSREGKKGKWKEEMPTLVARDCKDPKVVTVPRKEGANIVQLNNPSHSQQRVYSKEGISPTILAGSNGGGKEPCKIVEIEPCILRPERTEYGKKIRKSYENGEIKESRHNMKILKPRKDGISNTITTVQKDNLLAVPCLTPDRVNKRQNGRRFKEEGDPSFTLTSQDIHGVLIEEKKPFIIVEKYKVFFEKYGYIPEMFNPYNEKEVLGISPAVTTASSCTTSSSTVLIKEKNTLVIELFYKGKTKRLEDTIVNIENWINGNFSCDCNRSHYFDLGLACNTRENQIKIKLWDGNNLIYSEFEEDLIENKSECKAKTNKCIKEIDIPKNILNDNERQRRVYSKEGISPSVLARQDSAKILNIGKLEMKGSEQVRRVYDPNGLSPTIDTMQGGHRQPKVLTEKKENTLKFVGAVSSKDRVGDGKKISRNVPQGERVYDENGVACAQTAQGGGTGSYTGLYLRNLRIRKLTPKECWRLQGIKDEDFEKAEAVNSNTQLYKQAGNGVSVNVVMQLLLKLKEKNYI